MRPITYCVNHTVQMLEQKTSPVFRSDRLRNSQHEFCEYHQLRDSTDAAVKAACMEFDAEQLFSALLS